jgi:hypothetical protein
MALAGGRVAPLFASPSTGSGSVTINLGRPQFFVAWITVNMVDPTIDFDRDNAIAADIFLVDGSRTASRVFGGDHFGVSGSAANVFQGAVVGFGTRITFFLRIFGPDVSAAGEAVVVFWWPSDQWEERNEMATYVFYSRTTGTILHTHEEVSITGDALSVRREDLKTGALLDLLEGRVDTEDVEVLETVENTHLLRTSFAQDSPMEPYVDVEQGVLSQRKQGQ